MVEEPGSTDDGEATHVGDVQPSAERIVSEATPPTIEPAQKDDAIEGEQTTTYSGQIDHADLLDFLRYLPPIETIYQTYQPTQTLPSDVEQLAFPPSNDHTALKLPANNENMLRHSPRL